MISVYRDNTVAKLGHDGPTGNKQVKEAFGSLETSKMMWNFSGLISVQWEKYT